MRERLGPELQVAGVAAFWGSIGLVVREIDLPALTIVAYRVAIASVALVLWLVLAPDAVGRRFVVHRPGRTLLQGVVLAVHWVLFFAALQRAPVGLVTLIVFLAPVLMAAVAPYTLGEHLTRRVAAALGLALLGTILLVGLGAEDAEPVGILYAVLAAVLLAVLFINAKVLSPLYGGRRLALAQVTVAAAVLVPVALVGGDVRPTEHDLIWLLVLGLVHTALGPGHLPGRARQDPGPAHRRVGLPRAGLGDLPRLARPGRGARLRDPRRWGAGGGRRGARARRPRGRRADGHPRGAGSGGAEFRRLRLVAQDGGMFLGEDLLAYLVLAIGGALCVGNVLAIIRPPEQVAEGDLDRAPVGRSVVMAVAGGIAALWALASLLAG